MVAQQGKAVGEGGVGGARNTFKVRRWVAYWKRLRNTGLGARTSRGLGRLDEFVLEQVVYARVGDPPELSPLIIIFNLDHRILVVILESVIPVFQIYSGK